MESDATHLRQYARTGDADAFARLVTAHAGMVFAAARRVTGDTHLAEDATQNAFLALARDAGRVRTNVVGWLHRTATHRALDAVRARRRADRRDRVAARAEATPATPADQDWADLLPEIDRAIAALPDDLRLPLVLHFLQSRSQGDVAAELGVDASTVSRRIDRAVESLRATLRRHGIAAPAALPAALGHCGPAAIPATLQPALVKIGLSGAGARRTATAGAKLPIAVAAGVALVGVVAWLVYGATGPIVAVAPPATAPAVLPAAPPATAPTTRPAVAPPAIDLIRAVVDAERWIDGVQGLSIETESLWHRSQEAAASEAAALKKQFPGERITPDDFPETRAGDSLSRNHIAFDAQRARVRDQGEQTTTLNLWTGAKGYSRWQTPRSHQDSIGIHPTVGTLFEITFGYQTWPSRSHRFWFSPPTDISDASRSLSSVEENLWPEAVVRGPVLYRGVWCWVVIFRNQGTERWYVGMDDHRLYRSIHGYVSDREGFLNSYVRAAAARGATVHTIKEFFEWEDPWEAAFSDLQRRQIEFERLLGDVNIDIGLTDDLPAWENSYADYREVSPGCWMPMRRGWILRKTEKGVTFEEVNKEVTVTSVRVNQPLPDDWFQFPLADAEGAQVVDRTFSPPLIYKWKNDRTPAEWQTVFDEAKKRQADEDARQAAMNRVLHQPAPAFGGGEWRNGPARTWADFAGKVVVVSFWGEWCGPCRNDLPALVQVAGDPAAGITVVGVHTAGSRPDKIDAHLRQFGISYPIYVDTADDGGGFGKVTTTFGVRALPQTFVIDSGGRVAAQGPLGETLPVARRLAREAATRPAGELPGE